MEKNENNSAGLEKQKEYISMLEDILYLRAGGQKPKAFVHTYGCQQNVSDSEKIKGGKGGCGYYPLQHLCRKRTRRGQGIRKCGRAESS